MESNKNDLITAIYMRVSTEEQSIGSQLHAISTYLAYKGFTRCQNYVDHGLSGKDTNRPAFKTLLDDVKRGKVRRVIVYKLDRLSRSMNDLLNTVARFKEGGASFHSISELIDLETPQGELMFHMMGAFAHFERQLISERTVNGLKAARKRGSKLGRRRTINRTAVLDLIEGGATYREIARQLNISLGAIGCIRTEHAKKIDTANTQGKIK